MGRSWIVLIMALVSLASCSVEKRLYQPGYYIEWNPFASQDQFQDVSQGRSEGASQDLPQDLSENLEIDVTQDPTQDVSQSRSEGASQDLPQDLSENLEIDVTQDATHDVSQGRSEGASQDLPQDLSENLSQNIDSDFEKILLILLALFLPALTIFLSEGFSKNFWISAILMLLAFSLPVPSFLKLLIEVLAIVLAIAVVLHYL